MLGISFFEVVNVCYDLLCVWREKKASSTFVWGLSNSFLFNKQETKKSRGPFFVLMDLKVMFACCDIYS